MAYVVYLGELLFPVTPSKITAKYKGQNKTASLIDGSQINMLKPPALAEISFDALIPQQPYHFAMYENSAVIPKSYKKVLKKKDFQEGYKGNGYLKPDYFFAWLEVLKVKKQIVNFTIYREKPGIKMRKKESSLFHTELKVSLEDYTIKEDAGEGMDFIVSITLKAYEPYGTKEAVLKKSRIKKIVIKREGKPDIRVRELTVKKGDTLQNIVRKFCKNVESYKAKDLYQDNKKVIEKAARKHGRKSSSKGHYLYEGTKLRLPGR